MDNRHRVWLWLSAAVSSYARFLAGILNAKEQRKAIVNEMLQTQITINYKAIFGPDAWVMTDEYQDIALARGLDWGVFDTLYGRAAPQARAPGTALAEQHFDFRLSLKYPRQSSKWVMITHPPIRYSMKNQPIPGIYINCAR